MPPSCSIVRSSDAAIVGVWLGAGPSPARGLDLAHARRRHHERQAQKEEDHRHRWQIGWQREPLGDGIDDLEAEPAGSDIDEEHLPDRAVVDLDDQPLEMGHTTTSDEVSMVGLSCKMCFSSVGSND